jgi:transposase, IS5 family
VDAIEEAEKTHYVNKKHRTRKRKARKDYLLHQKLGRKSKRQRRKMQKKALRYVKRNLKQLDECISDLKKHEQELTKNEKKTLARLEDIKTKTSSIAEQQEQLSKNKTVSNRIVSFHHQEVRPMVRGKFPISVEFGKKNLLVEKDGFLYLAGSFFDNVSDTTLMEQALEYCESNLSLSPEGIGADRGFHSLTNRESCKKRSMKRIGIQRKGRPKKCKPSTKEPWEERIRRRRCGIEGHISVAKRWYGLNRATYRIEDGEEMHSRLGLVVMNLKKAVSKL